MKIERINENQIRCTLDRSDLADRHIELGELAYGSEKARELFHELIQTAADEVGFQIENMPVMVEAIPMSMDSIVLIVTRVEDPDELDTRFSHFSPNTEEEWDEPDSPEDLLGGLLDGASLIKELLKQGTAALSGIQAQAAAEGTNDADTETAKSAPAAPGFRIFAFPTLDSVATAAAALSGVILVQSKLYKDPIHQQYYLCIHQGDQEDAFRRTCNTLSEYGALRHSTPSVLAHCEEHFEVIIASRALDRLAKLA